MNTEIPARNSAIEDPQPSCQTVVKVLLISPCDEDHQGLREILRHSKWEQYGVRTQNEGLEFLRTNVAPVVICESELPDGTWKGLLNQFACMQCAPALVVSSCIADEVLWSETVNLGAYSVLAKPFDMKEVVHVVSCAWLNWKDKWEPRKRESVKSHSAWPETQRKLARVKAVS